MYLLVGLGNPGASYEGNRHNIGFMAIDAMHRHFSFGPWRKKFQSELSEGNLPGISEKVVLLKPQTYMNNSGQGVQAALQFYKMPLENVFVFHDELDVAPGKIKIKQGGGAGGHNGLRSIDEHCGQDYWRVRLGIGHPGVHHPEKADMVTGYVLSDFAKADKVWLEPLIEDAAKHVPVLLLRGQADYLSRLAPPKEKKEKKDE